MWIDCDGDHFVVKASNNRRGRARRSWKSEPLTAADVTGALDRAIVEVQTWMAEA
jgi:hypothetical protein